MLCFCFRRLASQPWQPKWPFKGSSCHPLFRTFQWLPIVWRVEADVPGLLSDFIRTPAHTSLLFLSYVPTSESGPLPFPLQKAFPPEVPTAHFIQAPAGQLLSRGCHYFSTASPAFTFTYTAYSSYLSFYCTCVCPTGLRIPCRLCLFCCIHLTD